MAQPNSLLDLLTDDEDEGPGSASEFTALLRGNLVAASTSQSGAEQVPPQQPKPGAVQAQAGPPASMQTGRQNVGAAPSTAQKPSRGLSLQALLKWCKVNLSAEEMRPINSALRELKVRVTQGDNSKDIYTSLYQLIGTERMKKCRDDLLNEELGLRARSAGPSGQQQVAVANTTGAARQGQQGIHPQMAPSPRQEGPSTASGASSRQPPRQGTPVGQPHGSSIMQSLMYNAEQARQQVAQLPGQQRQANGVKLEGPPPQAMYHHPLQIVSNGPISSGMPVQTGQPVHSVPAQPAAGRGFGPAGTTALGKHAADGQPSQQTGMKKAKKDKEDVEDENDILKDSGINLDEEQNALLGTLERTTQAHPQNSQPEVTEDPFLNLAPLGIKIADIAKRHGLPAVDPQVGQLLSRATDAHLGLIIQRIFTMARQRTDADRSRPGMVLSENLRRKLHEINMRQKEKQEARDMKEHDSLLQVAGSKKKQQDEELSKKAEKANRKETEKQQASAANAAAAAAFGSKAQKWGAWSIDTAKKPFAKPKEVAKADTGTKPAAKDTSSSRSLLGATEEPLKGSALPPSRVHAEMMSAKLSDLVAVLERDPGYQKSTLLYKLYDQLTE